MWVWGCDSRDRTHGLGRTAIIVDDVDTTADVLAQMHGGERRAAHWLRGVLARLDERGWS